MQHFRINTKTTNDVVHVSREQSIFMPTLSVNNVTE